MTTLAQRSFAGGELAPALYPRCDTVKYSTGARTIRNLFIMKHGGLASRPGGTFVAEVKNSTKTIRFIPFVFNASQTYVLEFGDLYMRVHRNGQQITDGDVPITNVTQANPAVVTTLFPHGFANGDEVAISGVSGMTQLNGRNFKVAGVTASTYQLQLMDGTPLDSTAYTAYQVATFGLSSHVFELVTPFVVADISALQFVQSASIITIAHPNYAPQQVSKTSVLTDYDWAIGAVTIAPSVIPPTGLTGSNGPWVSGAEFAWVVTSIDPVTGDESVPSAIFIGPLTVPTTLTWTPPTGITTFNIYRNIAGIYGYVGTSGGGVNSLIDEGVVPGLAETPPIARNPFSSSGNYPATVSYYQQRLLFGNSNNSPQTVWTSRSGRFQNFTISSPSQSDDAITFSLVGRQVNSIQHLVDIGKLVVLTSGGELAALGDANGVLTPSAINTRQYSYHGSSNLAPVIIGTNLLYLQARQSVVRSLAYSFQIDGYTGTDLTMFSTHLFQNYSVVDWAYQQVPNSILWAVRSDGALLGLTYIEEQQIWGWHRHDFDGFVENVCSVPEGNEDALYLLVRRTINGETKRYVERMATRQVLNIVDYVGLDASLKYDGRNTSAVTMTLTGGTGDWDYNQTLTLTGSTVSGGFIFQASDVGNQIFLDLTDNEGNVTSRIRFTITGYTGAHVVTGTPNRDVDLGLQGVAITSWTKAVKQVGGLWHIEGKEVSVFADGFVVSSPNNAAYPTLTVTNGTLTFSQPYGVISAGLPFTCDLETLNIDSANGESMVNKNKNISQVSVWTELSRGLFIGSEPPEDDSIDPLEGLEEYKARTDEGYDEPIELLTDTLTVNIQPQWNSNGRVFLRQVDPLPLEILGVAPSGMVPIRGG